MGDPIVDVLATLGVDGLSARVLVALPLVEVAWADGEVQAAERELLLRLAEEKLGIGEEGAVLLADWLLHRPSAGYFRSGRDALRTIAAVGVPGFEPAVLEDLSALADQVARAAGGVFGLGAVSRAESAALQEIGSFLKATAAAPAALAASLGADEVARVTTTLASASMEAEGIGLRGVIVVGDEKHAVTRAGLELGSAAVVRLEGAEPVHACVIERQRKYYVEDRSRAGTFVNGERVGRRRLLGGERVRLGTAEVVFKMQSRSARSPG